MIYWTHLHTLNACEWTDLKYYWVSTKSILPPYGEGWGTNSTSFRNSSSRIHWAHDRHLVVSTYGCQATLLVHLTLRLGIGPCATCRKFALILVVERGIAYEPLNSNEGRWRQNFIDLKCFQEWKFITLLILVDLSHYGVRGTSGLMGITFLSWVQWRERWMGGDLNPWGTFVTHWLVCHFVLETVATL